MTAPGSDSFQRALARFKKSTLTRSPDLLSQFQNSNLEDLRAVCDGIQTDMGKNGHLRSMNRLKGFIEAMEQLGQTIEIFVNASEFVCFVWVSETLELPCHKSLANTVEGMGRVR